MEVLLDSDTHTANCINALKAHHATHLTPFCELQANGLGSRACIVTLLCSNSLWS